MNANKCERKLIIKPSFPRHIGIDENIYEALSIHSLSLYMALRYNAEFGKDDSEIVRSAKFLYTKAKISRPQYYRCMQELEEQGLVLRDPDSKLGEKCIIHVARELGYFTRGVHTVDRGVSERDRGVSDRDTDQYLSSLSSINTNTTSESNDSAPVAPKSKKQEVNDLMRELIDIYRQEFPNNPQPHAKLISTSLDKVLRGLIKRWPEADPCNKPLTAEAFRQYMKALKSIAPKFALGAYETKSGRLKKNGLETFCRWDNFVKFLEEQYS